MNTRLIAGAAALGFFLVSTVSFAQVSSDQKEQVVQQEQARVEQEQIRKNTQTEMERKGEEMRKMMDPKLPMNEGDRRMMEEGLKRSGMKPMPRVDEQGFSFGKEGETMHGKREGAGMMGEQMMNGGEEEMERRQKEMMNQQFTMMKRNLKNFSRGVEMMKKHVARTETRVAKCGVGIPEELKKALGEAEVVAQKVQTAENFDSLMDSIGSIDESGSVMEEWGPKMGDLDRLCSMLKRANKDLKQLARSVKKVEKDVARTAKRTKVDFSELLAEYKKEFEKVEKSLGNAKELAKTDPDAALDMLEDDFYGAFEDVKNGREGLEMAMDLTQGLKTAKQELRGVKRMISQVKKQGKDASQLEGLHTQMKSMYDEITSLSKGKQSKEQLEGIMDKISEATELKDQYDETLEELGMSTQVPKFERGKGVDFKRPEGFRDVGAQFGLQRGQPKEEFREDQDFDEDESQ